LTSTISSNAQNNHHPERFSIKEVYYQKQPKEAPQKDYLSFCDTRTDSPTLQVGAEFLTKATYS